MQLVILGCPAVFGELNEREILIEEVRGEAVNGMKAGKVPRLDELPVKCLKKGVSH